MRFVLSILLGWVLLTACQKEQANYTANITILNAVPDAPGFDVRVGAVTIGSTNAFGLPDYNVQMPAVTDTVGWKPRGAAAYDSLMLTDLPSGADFTLLFFDSMSRRKSLLLRDRWQQPASESQGYLRFFPMIVGTDTLRLTNDTLGVLSGLRFFGDFYKHSNAGAFTAIDTMHTVLRLLNKRANTIDTIASLPAAAILPGKSYSLYAVGVRGQLGAKQPRLILHEHP